MEFIKLSSDYRYVYLNQAMLFWYFKLAVDLMFHYEQKAVDEQGGDDDDDDNGEDEEDEDSRAWMTEDGRESGGSTCIN